MAFCNLHGMRLASITNEQENNDVVKQLENFGKNILERII
jgi:hypothetical protein